MAHSPVHARKPIYLLVVTLSCAACAFDQAGIEEAAGGRDADVGLSLPDAAPTTADANGNDPDSNFGGADAPISPPDASTQIPDASDEAGEIACGEANCIAPDVCCVTRPGMAPNVEAECTAPDDCASRDSVTCDGPEDCAGPDEVCCQPSLLDSATSCAQASGCFVVACSAESHCPDANSECCDTDYGVGYCSTLGCL